MALPRPAAARGPVRLLVALVALAALAACEMLPLPILRGGGSEHRQGVAVGLPF